MKRLLILLLLSSLGLQASEAASSSTSGNGAPQSPTANDTETTSELKWNANFAFPATSLACTILGSAYLFGEDKHPGWRFGKIAACSVGAGFASWLAGKWCAQDGWNASHMGKDTSIALALLGGGIGYTLGSEQASFRNFCIGAGLTSLGTGLFGVWLWNKHDLTVRENNDAGSQHGAAIIAANGGSQSACLHESSRNGVENSTSYRDGTNVLSRQNQKRRAEEMQNRDFLSDENVNTFATNMMATSFGSLVVAGAGAAAYWHQGYEGTPSRIQE